MNWTHGNEQALTGLPLHFHGQDKFLRERGETVWDAVCARFGSTDNDHGPWFTAGDAAECVPGPFARTSKAQRSGIVLKFAVAVVDPECPSIEKEGTRYRLLNPRVLRPDWFTAAA